MESIVCTHSVGETERFAASFAASLRAGDVVALYGGLGMGKTAFVRGLAAGLHTTSEVTSPTYTLVHEYEADLPIAHFDMYRIRSMDDLYSTGFFDYLDSGCVLVIEWSENVDAFLPPDARKIRIERGGAENERRVILSNADLGDGRFGAGGERGADAGR